MSAMSAQLVLPGDNPDVANVILEHDGGAISNLTASYASASEYYLMNIYGKESSAYYDLFEGLRIMRRHGEAPERIECPRIDTIREELEEFAACVREGRAPEVGGELATRSLAVIRAGLRSVAEGRTVEVSEILDSPAE